MSLHSLLKHHVNKFLNIPLFGAIILYLVNPLLCFYMLFLLLFKVYWKYTCGVILNNFTVVEKNARIVSTKKFICFRANKEQIITYMMPHHPNISVCISYTEGHLPTCPHRAIQNRKLTSREPQSHPQISFRCRQFSQ